MTPQMALDILLIVGFIVSFGVGWGIVTQELKSFREWITQHNESHAEDRRLMIADNARRDDVITKALSAISELNGLLRERARQRL